jgi:pimeloyl-ACP methyl ester carboxylesterase
VVVFLDRRPYYFALFILTILMLSSFYLSWSVDRGMGELTVERYRIERAPGRPVDFLVYQPRSEDVLDPMPIALTIHGLAGSKEGMYAFNIELARRNFTVVSVDLAGHGDNPLPFIVDDFSTMADDCYAALRYVQENWANVDNETYGVLSHSLGFRIAIELQDFPVAPRGYAAVGDVGQMSLGEYVDFPGNLLIAVGQYDEMITTDDALNAIRTATGNASAEAGVTYGSLVNQTAYRLAFGPTDHVFEAIDQTIVGESAQWLIAAVQGEGQVTHSLDPMSQIFFNKTIGMAGGVLFMLVSVVPLLFIVYSFVPQRIRPKERPVETAPPSVVRTFIYGSILGAIAVGIYTATSAIGFHLENLNLFWPNSMFVTGLNLFYIFTAAALLVTMWIMMGGEGFKKAFASVGVGGESLRDNITDMLKGLFVASVGIAWLLVWIAVCGLPEQMQPWIALALVKWPVWDRGVNTIIVATISVPYLVVDAAMLRGLLMGNRTWKGGRSGTKTLILAFASKMAIMGLLAVVVVFGTTALGFIAGKMVLLGLLLLLTLIVSILTTSITLISAAEFKNTWAAIFLAAFMLAIVVVSSLPLM